MAHDIRDVIFAAIENDEYTACLTSEAEGVVSGIERLKAALAERNVAASFYKKDGETVAAGERILLLNGTPKTIAVAEEFVVGMLSKPSGIATAARRAVSKAGGMRIVSGAWKKMPPEIKHIVREAVSHGGAYFRIIDEPFVYLDKNFVRMLGGIKETLLAVKAMTEIKAIQVKGDIGDIAGEACVAAEFGAGIIMVDTGSIDDFRAVNTKLKAAGYRGKVKLAYAKGITLQSIAELQTENIDILDIGGQIIDASLLDMKFDVVRS